MLFAAIAFIAIGCTEDPLEPDNSNQEGTEQTPGTGDNGNGDDSGEDPGENPGGENPDENPENPGENPEEPTLPGTEISLFDFAQLPNTDETLYRVSGVVWGVDVDENETMVFLGTCLYEEDYDFDPTKDAAAVIINPTWLKDLSPALRPGHVLTVVGNKGSYGDDPDGDTMILNSQYVSHVDYSEPYLVFDLNVMPYLGSEAGDYKLNVYSNTDWTVSAPAGTTVSPTSGNGCAEVTFTYPANTKFEEAKYPVVFNYSGKTKVLEFQQRAIEYSLELSTSYTEVAADATTASVDVVSNGSWTVTCPEGVTASPASGEGDATVTFTFAENKTAEQVDYNVAIAGGNHVCEFIIAQAPYEGPLPLTVAEFLAKPISTEYYQLTGVIKGTYNTTYGNFYLKDETGEVLVYGLTATQQTDNDKSFASLGLRDGDTLTLIGQRADYNGTAQVGGPAYYVSHVAAPFVDFSSASASVDAEATTYTIEVLSNTDWTATPSAGVSLSKTSGNGNASVVMTFAANTAADAVNHTVAFAYEGATATFTLTQKAVPAAGETVVFEETFAKCTGTMGWSGSVANGTFTADNTGWTVQNAYGANGAAKFGASSKLGTAQTPALNFTGTATLTFKAGAWSGDSTNLKLSMTNGTLSVSKVTLKNGDWTEYEVTITGATSGAKIMFEGNAASKGRFFLDDVKIVQNK